MSLITSNRGRGPRGRPFLRNTGLGSGTESIREVRTPPRIAQLVRASDSNSEVTGSIPASANLLCFIKRQLETDKEAANGSLTSEGYILLEDSDTVFNSPLSQVLDDEVLQGRTIEAHQWVDHDDSEARPGVPEIRLAWFDMAKNYGQKPDVDPLWMRSWHKGTKCAPLSAKALRQYKKESLHQLKHRCKATGLKPNPRVVKFLESDLSDGSMADAENSPRN
ncbi:hypothetical protein DFH09DRAFT_1081084 [Mycena vulgaris]|nr:hypothetical protein DFH09DRAFT_1081084 [Mycena vulgaris]